MRLGVGVRLESADALFRSEPWIDLRVEDGELPT